MKVQRSKFVFEFLGVITLVCLSSLYGVPSADAGPEPHLKSGMFGVVRGQSAPGKHSYFNKTELITLKIALVAPIPSANTITATTENAGFRKKNRIP